MKKRIVSTLLAAAMAASMLAGCGSSAKETAAVQAGKESQAGDTTAQAQEENADDAGASDKPLKVVYLCNGNLGDKGFNDSAASGMQMLADKMGPRSRPSRWAGTKPATRAIIWMCLSRTGT